MGRPSKNTHFITLRVWGENWENLKDESNRSKLINELIDEYYKRIGK